VSRYQKGETNLDFTETRDSELQWHQLGHMQVCTSLQTDNHASTQFLQAGRPSCCPTNSVKALKATFSLRDLVVNNSWSSYQLLKSVRGNFVHFQSQQHAGNDFLRYQDWYRYGKIE